MQVLHEARQDLFCVIIDPGASKANARAVKSCPGTPLELFSSKRENKIMK